MSLILDTLPSPEEFFDKFWNKKPFVVRSIIPKELTSALIDEDHLAGLAMEDEVKSRLVRKGGNLSDWTCDYGPFEDTDFADLGDQDWSLLVQNIDQYDEQTAELLKHFNFCPRWLLDDIMVSFSPKGGTVGEHVDSYHVFLVQGKGSRRWKVAREAIQKEDYIEDIPLEILKHGFEGEEITVEEGDVIYIPPKFAHRGVSLAPSLTYSVGFLGPSLSEMLIDFGHYLEEHHADLPRYLGQDLNASAAHFQLPSKHANDLNSFMAGVFEQDYFANWLSQYFARPSHPVEIEHDMGLMDAADLIEQETMLIKPPRIKLLFTPLKAPEKYSVTVGTASFEIDFSSLKIFHEIAQETPFSAGIFRSHPDILQELIDQNTLEVVET